MRNKRWIPWLILAIAVLAIVVYMVFFYTPRTAQETPATQTGEAVSPTPGASLPATLDDLLGQISSARMFATLEDLTAIQPHSGWRGSATEGEKEALDYMQARLDELTWLGERGMTQEREEFHVFLGSEDHTTSVYLSKDGEFVEVPADSFRGHRDDPSYTLQNDSDGQLNDLTSNPVTLEEPLTLIPDDSALDALAGSDQSGNILLADFALVADGNAFAQNNISRLFALKPAAIILVTQFSNAQGVTHGSFAGDKGGALQAAYWGGAVPILFIEMENLAPLGITDWDGMAALSTARVAWDVDVSNPATSGNLIVHIPGEATGSPILISAHIDSAHSPGALDDGSGSVILLEIATLLNEAKLQPYNDLYLAWWGSEEIGLYGSSYFTTTHSDLLNLLQANIQIDCLTRPLDGLPVEFTLMFSHINGGSIAADPFAGYLFGLGEQLGIPLETYFWPLASDNGSLSAFNVPNVNLIYESQEMNDYPGGVWVAGHLHDPYDQVDLVRDMEDELINLTRLPLSAVFTPIEPGAFVDHTSEKLAVFVASHTESPHMTPSGLSNFSLALSNAGYRISVIPYDTAVTEAAISGADLVVILPAHDYPVASAEPPPYDTAWLPEEAVVIDRYVNEGGRVLVVNSAKRLKFYNSAYDENEDWADLNLLTSAWGVTFTESGGNSSMVDSDARKLFDGVATVRLTPGNAVAFTLSTGDVLAGNSSQAYAAQVKVGKGEVLILSDLSMLGDYENSVLNPRLVENIANWK